MTHDELLAAFDEAYTKTLVVPPTAVCPRCGFQTVTIIEGEYCVSCWKLVDRRKERP